MACLPVIASGRPAAADAPRWRAMVADELHPGTSTARTAAAGVWSLYEESGYVRLPGKQPDEFGPAAGAVDHARARLGDVADLGCQVVWQTPGGLPVRRAAPAAGLRANVDELPAGEAARGRAGRHPRARRAA